MVNVTVTGDREVRLALERIKNATPKMLLDIVKRSAYAIEEEAKENLSGKVLNVRTGRLRRSIMTRVKGGRNPSARVGTNVIYAPVHEYGMTIRAKSAPYLHFPIHTSTRIMSKSGKQLKRGIRQFSWVKVKQVTIPARPFMATAFKAAMPKIDRIMQEEIDKTIK